MNTLTKKNGNQRGMVQPGFWNFPVLEDFFGARDWFNPLGRSMPAVNVSEDDKNFTVEVIAPGFQKEDFKVNADDDVLTISAETRTEPNPGDKEYSRREYSCSSFTRSFNLPDNAKRENIEATYSDGILHLKIAKDGTQTKPTKTIPIN
jgi:HSP20 family protein